MASRLQLANSIPQNWRFCSPEAARRTQHPSNPTKLRAWPCSDEALPSEWFVAVSLAAPTVFLALDVVADLPFFIARHHSLQKRIAFLTFSQCIAEWKRVRSAPLGAKPKRGRNDFPPSISMFEERLQSPAPCGVYSCRLTPSLCRCRPRQSVTRLGQKDVPNKIWHTFFYNFLAIYHTSFDRFAPRFCPFQNKKA